MALPILDCIELFGLLTFDSILIVFLEHCVLGLFDMYVLAVINRNLRMTGY